MKSYRVSEYLPSVFSGDLNRLWLDIVKNLSLYVNPHFHMWKRSPSFWDTSFFLLSSNPNTSKLNHQPNRKYRPISGNCICNHLPSWSKYCSNRTLYTNSFWPFSEEANFCSNQSLLLSSPFFSFFFFFFPTCYLFKLKGATFCIAFIKTGAILAFIKTGKSLWDKRRWPQVAPGKA